MRAAFFMLELDNLIEALSVRLYESQHPLLVAIDGRCASGKSTLAQKLAQAFGAPVIHMDDFYLPFSLRTPQRLQQPGGHMDWERLESQVLQPAAQGKALEYHAYNAHANAWKEPLQIPPQKIYIVEGTYSLLPQLEDYYGYKIFLTVDSQAQTRRLQEREGSEKLEAFLTRWIPAEEKYFAACQTRAHADAAFDTSDQEN